MIRIRAPKDFWAGLLFIAIGAVSAVVATGYAMGTATRMGPGYLPTVLSWGTMLLGLAVTARSFAIEGAPVARIVARPLLLLLAAIVVFALTIQRGGFVLACIATVLIGGLASRELGWRELIALSLGLTTFCVVVFIYGLGQPIELWPH
jgi:Tripartite tricarboxylate transporter TctB family